MSTLSDSFWSRVEKTASCWLWRGHIIKGGYGRVQLNGRISLVHRLSYEASNGPVPDGLFVLHDCDVPNCVRPDHLFLGTQADNNADCVAKGRQSKGESHPKSKLRPEHIPAIRGLRVRGMSVPRIARAFGVTNTTIVQVLTGKTWSHVKGVES